ncbi:hypothetical protein [Nannocystis pusilla]|uniref:hypothetical protein n=1 Tax=Nannocystis pusilla TaxID=889268 RepID=UPI003DA4A0F9
MNAEQIISLVDQINTLRQTITARKEQDWLTFASFTNTLARAINVGITIPDTFPGDWEHFHTHPIAENARQVVTVAERFLRTVPRDSTQLLLLQILGQIFRIEQHLEMSVPVSDGVVYGLLKGIEEAIDHAIPEELLPERLTEAGETFLDEFYKDPAKMAKVKGFYDIEQGLAAVGIDRARAIKLLTYLHNDSRFGEITVKMNSQHSPVEVKDLELSEFETGYKKKKR